MSNAPDTRSDRRDLGGTPLYSPGGTRTRRCIGSDHVMRELTLHQTNASGPLVPSRFKEVFALLAKLGTTPYATMHGQELRLAVALSLTDDACAALLLDFPAQGQRVRGTAHGPSSSLLVWAFHQLAKSLRCTLTDPEQGGEIAPDPDQHRGRALAYLADYEDEVRAARRTRSDSDDATAFIAWLAREELIVLTKEAAAFGSELPMNDGPALYEQLLDSDAVEDVFVSERELGWLLARFRARHVSH